MGSLYPAHHNPGTQQLSALRLKPSHAFGLICLIPVLRFLYLDYRKYLALGPGGTPASITGYLRVTVLGFFALRNPYEPPQVPRYMAQKQGFLTSLPKREGVRPKTFGIAPHRQISQTAAPSIFASLSTAIRTIAQENDGLVEGTSCFEKHGSAIFSVNPQRRTCRGEICHAHPSDGSLHLTLHPADAKVMLKAGWGERHPLARGGWLERFVPGGFVMVYSPRTDEEIEVVLDIVHAAAWWVGGSDIDIPEKGRRDSIMRAVDVEDSEAYQTAKRNSSITANQALFEL